MATVNFSVPDDVKQAFDEAFGDRNKSAIIAELMRAAVRDDALRRRREQLFRQLSASRSALPRATLGQIRKLRAAGRSG